MELYVDHFLSWYVVWLHVSTLFNFYKRVILLVMKYKTIMELQLLTFIFITFLVFLFAIFKITQESKAKKLPPGPWRLPFIGNLHQMVSSSLPHHHLRDLASKYGPLMHLQLGEVSTIVVSSPEIAEDFLKTHDLIFAERPSLLSFKYLSYDYKDIIFAPYGNYWRQIRKICTIEVFGTKRVQSFKPIREEEVSNFIKTIQSSEGSLVNLSEKIFALTYGITSRAALGNRCKDRDKEAFKLLVLDLNHLCAGFSISDFYPSIKVLEVIGGMKPKLENVMERTDKILQDIINQHKERRLTTIIDREKEEEDLVDVFLKLQETDDLGFPLTDTNIKAIIYDIFSAGSETSSTVVDWAMAEMMKNPRVMKKAQAEVRHVFEGKGTVDEGGLHELHFMKAVIKETLRLHPGAPLSVPRVCRENCEINGYTIPVKSRLIVNSWAIARDPRYWNEAEKFYPKRFLGSSIDFKGTDFQYIPFGAGRRMCPGVLFAQPNIELPLAQLLYHFDWELPKGMKIEDLDMTEEFAVTVKKKNDLLLIPIRYRPFTYA